MAENKLEYEGKTYKATKATRPGSCEGCAFDELWKGCSKIPCSATDRGDGIDIIFVEETKQQEQQHDQTSKSNK